VIGTIATPALFCIAFFLPNAGLSSALPGNLIWMIAVIDNYNYEICGHVNVEKYARHPISALHLSSSFTGLFTPCRNVVESCTQCLTDYDTTVEQRWVKIRDGKGKRMSACWFITITSYHRLGGGRSPSDTKWHAFAARGFWDLFTLSRDMIRYPQGAVRQVWKEAES